MTRYRGVYCKSCKTIHEIEPVYERCQVEAPAKKSWLSAPGIIYDTMPPVQSMQNGKMYDSKSAIRRHYREAGVVEVGNDPARNKPFVKLKPDKKKIRESLRKAEARINRGEYTEATKRKHA